MIITLLQTRDNFYLFEKIQTYPNHWLFASSGHYLSQVITAAIKFVVAANLWNKH